MQSSPKLVKTLLTCLLAAGALALLAGCGGGSDDTSDGPIGEASQEALFLSCDESGECVEAPPECVEDEECIEPLCGANSGGCLPAIRPGGGILWQGDQARLCFELEVLEDPTNAPGPATSVATDAGDTDTGGTDGGTTAECAGTSYPVEGLDLATFEGDVETSSDGQVTWTQEELSLLGTFVDGEFQVIEGP